MKLVNASTRSIAEFPQDRIPPYTILSHTWVDDEVVLADMLEGRGTERDAYRKIDYSCQQTLDDGFAYIWIDSCCIDKSSSAELSEAINSMYRWYQKAEKCYAYLVDVSDACSPLPARDGDKTIQLTSEFARSRWFTRGWTLQELLAPNDMIFYSRDWIPIGRKITLAAPLSIVTGIDEDVLLGSKPLEWTSVAKRMSWAAHRQTTRTEDIAYCLMGLFAVNMPMLYGEGGERAFVRLQEEIMKQTDDQSLFAWVDTDAEPDAIHGLLAKSPYFFRHSNTIVPYHDWEPRKPFSATNRGLCIDLPLTRNDEDIYVAALDCPAPPDLPELSFLAIYLQVLSAETKQYAKVRAGILARCTCGELCRRSI